MEAGTQTAQQNRLLAAALHYADCGYPVFPIAPGRKDAPLTPNGFLNASTDEETIRGWWSRYPDANIGAATAGLLILDLDGSNNDWLRKRTTDEQAALAVGPMVLTPRGGTHRWFVRPPGKSWRCTVKVLANNVDTRTNGGYVVMPPSVAPNEAGQLTPYRWCVDAELDVSADRLPEPPLWLISLLDDIEKGRGTSEMYVRSDGEIIERPTLGNIIPDGQRDDTLARLAGTMRRVGMSRSEIEAALIVVNRERCRPPVDLRQVKKVAWSVSRYEPDQVSVAIAEGHWDQLQKEAAQEQREPEVADPGPLPPDLFEVPGFVGEVMRFTLSTAPCPQPALAFAGALCLQATLAGRKVMDARGNRTNIYVLGLADSGTGKNHPRLVNREILFRAGTANLEMPEEPASDTGLVASLQVQPASLLQIDEFSRLMATTKDGKKGWLYGIPTILLKLYSSAGARFCPKAYADAERNKMIDQPCLVLFGTSVAHIFFRSLDLEAIEGGLVGRLLAVEGDNDPPEQWVPWTQPPDHIVEAAKWWANFNPTGGNMMTIHPMPKVVPTTDEAAAVFRLFSEECRAMRLQFRRYGSIWARAVEKACRLALIYACSERRETPVITPAAATWACAFARWFSRWLAYKASRHLAESAHQDQQNDVLHAIEAMEAEGIRPTKTALIRRTRKLTSQQRDSALDTLAMSGMIVIEKAGTADKKTTYFKTVGGVNSSKLQEVPSKFPAKTSPQLDSQEDLTATKEVNSQIPGGTFSAARMLQ